jgi:heterodisulfide reductase subunit D
MAKLDIPNIEDVYVCLQCGYCKSYCPTGSVMGWESFAPRGKVYWLKKISTTSWIDRLFRRTFEPDEEWMKTLFTCTLCGRCEAVCHTDIKFHEFWEDTRRYLVEQGLKPPGGSIDMFNSIFDDRYWNPFQEPREKRDEWYKDDYTMPKEADIIFFIGCMTSYHEYKLLLNVLKVFTAAGINFTTMGVDEKCCGAINLMTGQFNRYDELAKHNVNEFKKRKASKIVTGCPGCYRGIKRYEEYVDKFDFEILHTTELLADIIHSGKLELKKDFKDKNKPLAYHDPCELGRISDFEGNAVYEQPRFILENVPNLGPLLEFPSCKRHSTCCGGGGGLKAVDYDVSAKITLTKIDDAIDIGASSIASACPNCLGQITVGTKMKKDEIAEKTGEKFKMNVFDIYDIVAKSIK